MSVPVNTAHQILSRFCGHRIGIGVAESIFDYVFEQTIANYPPNLVIGSKHVFLNLPLSFKATVDGSHANVTLDTSNAAVGLRVQNLKVTLEIIIGHATTMATVEVVLDNLFVVSVVRSFGAFEGVD